MDNYNQPSWSALWTCSNVYSEEYEKKKKSMLARRLLPITCLEHTHNHILVVMHSHSPIVGGAHNTTEQGNDIDKKEQLFADIDNGCC